MKKKIYVLAISMIAVLAIVGISYSYLSTSRQSTNNQTLTLKSFDVQLLDDNTEVTINPALPETDYDGLKRTAKTFKIKNNGGVLASYKVSLIDGDTVSTMKNKNVRYRLKKTVGTGTPEILAIQNLNDLGLIDTGTIEVNQTISYELVCWIDYEASPANQLFSKVILVEGLQADGIDKSGANYPELVENMIPVYYSATSDTEGVWKKADSTNKNTSYKWFNYDEQMWANAVTVKESGTNTREYYLNAEQGTTIEMDDITTMWVWIPRYKYVIFNGNNETADEQMIDIVFEHGKETTGTVMCHDDIQTANDSDHSEICIDTKNNGIKNNVSTYTHPAFCFGNKKTDGTCNGEELTGFWMAKFEMSTDDDDCNTNKNATYCNKTDLNILIKPDQDSLRYETISTRFANIRRMETYGNIHGFEQDSNATTWLDESGNLTGEIANDSNTINTHMIKNMEWGAVAFLSQSKYGKQGNNDYEGAYKEIYLNNNSNLKSGYSGGSYNSSSGIVLNSNTYLYNNLINNGEGYKGTGASTTGTIYGVYDMSGTYCYTMSNIVDSTGNFNVSGAGIWNQTIIPLSKYYDKYSYSSSNGLTKFKLGDATKEIFKEILDNSQYGWYSDLIIYPENTKPWNLRGGYLTMYSGIYTIHSVNGGPHTNVTSRPVLTVSRNMPWLEN